jgi:hypothetical protein
MPARVLASGIPESMMPDSNSSSWKPPHFEALSESNKEKAVSELADPTEGATSLRLLEPGDSENHEKARNEIHKTAKDI